MRQDSLRLTVSVPPLSTPAGSTVQKGFHVFLISQYGVRGGGGGMRANTSSTVSRNSIVMPLRPTICLCGLLSGRALACRAFSMSSAVRPPTGDWSWWKNLRWMPLAKNKSLQSTKSLPLTLPIGEVACPESPASLKGPLGT